MVAVCVEIHVLPYQNCTTVMALWHLVLPLLCTQLLWKVFAVCTKVGFSSHIHDFKFVLVCLCKIHWYFTD